MYEILADFVACLDLITRGSFRLYLPIWGWWFGSCCLHSLLFVLWVVSLGRPVQIIGVAAAVYHENIAQFSMNMWILRDVPELNLEKLVGEERVSGVMVSRYSYEYRNSFICCKSSENAELFAPARTSTVLSVASAVVVLLFFYWQYLVRDLMSVENGSSVSSASKDINTVCTLNNKKKCSRANHFSL